MIRFVVLSRQRSGSAFLATSLASHPDIDCYREIFLPKNSDADAYRAYRSATLARKLDYMVRRQESVNGYLVDMYAARTDVSVLGFKFMYSQAKKYPQVVEWIKANDVKVIHLIRSNTLKMMVSREVSRSRKIYHSSQKVSQMKVALNPYLLKYRLRRLTEQVEAYRRLFPDNPYTEVIYETFVANRQQETRRILDFLGVPEMVSLESALVKINSYSLADVIKNYDQVVRVLQGTSYEKLLA